jgi:type IV pilus assembly protein PilW
MHPHARAAGRRAQRAARGFGLVEMMVSLALGLLVVGGAMVMFMATRQANGSTDNLSRVAESVRTSYDLLTREVREAGGMPCDAQLLTSNVLNAAQGGTPSWWATWGEALRGYTGGTAFPGAAFGSGVAERVSGTEAIAVRYGAAVDNISITAHATGTQTFTTNINNHGIAVGDLLLVCNYRQAAVFQVTAANIANGTFVHGTGSGTPGNCSTGLGLPTVCAPGSSVYQFSAGSLVGRYTAAGWYIGNNGRSDSGGRSLYRVTRLGPEEVADGVRDLQLRYLVSGASDYVASSAVADWTQVTAVRMDITYQGPDANVATNGSGTNAGRLTRTVGFTINLRNQQP